MKKTLIGLATVLSIAGIAATASANAPSLPLPARIGQIAVEVRHEHDCMTGAQTRLEQRHRRWIDEARVSGIADDERHWNLQLEHEQVVDQHLGLVERHEWIVVREGELRRTLRRNPRNRNALAQIAALESEERSIEREHRALLVRHEGLLRQHDQMITAAV